MLTCVSHRSPSFFWAILIFAISSLPAFTQQSSCQRLSDLKLRNTTITLAESMHAGPFKPTRSFGKPIDLPAFCRVAGVIKPPGGSSIRFEVWLPTSGWDGRFEQIGNGGYAGGIAYGFMAPQLRLGFATASTNDGHSSKSGPTWSIGHPQKVIDFGYRAVHETSIKAKAIVRAFYGKGPAYSYFDGCSDGGREALMEAQRFPDDFNGIIAGAPANYWTHLMAGFIWDEQATLPNPASYIPPSKLPVIQRGVLAACDSLDGVKDGLIEDPRRCHFNLEKLECNDVNGPDCLTATQVEAVKRIHEGPRNPVTGRQIFPGYELGAAAAPGDWVPWIVGLKRGTAWQFSLGNEFFGDMVFQNPQWNFRSMNFDSDVKLADKKFASILNSTNPNLSPFREHGGKLIQYQGWADSAISPLNSINYYNSVVRNTEWRDGLNWPEALKRTRSFYRLFMVPGMEHCTGGPGPDSFGGILQRRPPIDNAQHDVVYALERWVEQGVAPRKIIATKYKDDAPKKGVVMTRPLCPYPEEAHWVGRGSTNRSSNFVCKVLRNFQQSPSNPPQKSR